MNCTIFERCQRSSCSDYAHGLFSVLRLTVQNMVWCRISLYSYTLIVGRPDL